MRRRTGETGRTGPTQPQEGPGQPRWCTLLGFLLAGCDPVSQPCACDEGHGVLLCEGGSCTECRCLDLAPAAVDPSPDVTRFVDADAVGGTGTEADPWAEPDWETLDKDVAEGNVLVVFDAGDVWPDTLTIGRTDAGPNRVVLNGHLRSRTADGWVDAAGVRAVVPGVSTGFDDVVRSRVTVRGFDVTGSEDKGIYWRDGDEIVVEDDLVHGNMGTPAVSLDYTSRSGHRSTSFVVRNNHIWDQNGECIYIGGAEGEDIDAHELVVIENNLVHDCTQLFSTHADGINIKDRIGSVTVTRNVVFKTHWGIEIASPGEYSGNLVFATRSNGFHVTDEWGPGASGLTLQGDVVLNADEAGFYLDASNNPWTDVTLSRLTVVGAREAAIEAGGAGGITGVLDDVVLADAAVGLAAWSPMALAVGACSVHDVGLAGGRDFSEAAEVCVDRDPGFGDLGAPAGPDGRFFTDDDPWISAVGGTRPL